MYQQDDNTIYKSLAKPLAVNASNHVCTLYSYYNFLVYFDRHTYRIL
uniref:Uncharacterized protein n=1 Tax=Arundo donax TaxID=35708 RepID=A0A0A9BM08_ARUDO